LVSTDYSPIEVDLYEEEDKLVARFSNISDFEDKDLDISIEDNVLTVSGNVEEKIEEQDKKKKYYCKEIRKESFTRSMRLPVKVKAEATQAELKKGILKIEMPKAEEAKPKKISVKTKGE
jgi:HSP20 family protein